MPNKDSGFHSVSLPDPLLELVDQVAPRLGAKAKDGRRRDSRATAIEFLVRKALKDLADKGVLGQLQIPLTLYDGPPKIVERSEAERALDQFMSGED